MAVKDNPVACVFVGLRYRLKIKLKKQSRNWKIIKTKEEVISCFFKIEKQYFIFLGH